MIIITAELLVYPKGQSEAISNHKETDNNNYSKSTGGIVPVHNSKTLHLPRSPTARPHAQTQ